MVGALVKVRREQVLVFAASLTLGGCVPHRIPPPVPDSLPTVVAESPSPYPAAAVSSGREMLPGEVVFLHHEAGARVLVPPADDIATVEDSADDGRAGTYAVHAKGQGATTFDVASTSGVATHRVDVVAPRAGSLEEALVGLAARQASVRLYRRPTASASEEPVWIVDACFTDDDARLLLELARAHLGRIETIGRRIPRWESDGCAK